MSWGTIYLQDTVKETGANIDHGRSNPCWAFILRIMCLVFMCLITHVYGPLNINVCIYHYRKEDCVATVNAAILLIKRLFSELNVQEFELEVLKLALTVLLYSLCKMDILVSRNELNETQLTDVFGVCELALQEWVKRSKVVGGIYFGKSAQKATILLYGSTELKVINPTYVFFFTACFLFSFLQLWLNILSLEVPQNRKVADAWNTSVTRVIKQRVSKV